MGIGKLLFESPAIVLCRPLGQFACRRFFDHPIFLVGVGRSGTTALIQALGWHSALTSGGEAHLLGHLGGMAYAYQLGPVASAYRGSCRMPVAAFERRLKRLGFETVFGRGYGVVGAVLAPWFRDRQRVSSVRSWVAKTFPDQCEAEGLVELYPSAQFIYLHRDGLATVTSRTKFAGFRDASFETQCRIWADGAQRYSFLRNWDRALEIRHHDFVYDREEVFVRIFDFLGLAHEETPAAFASSTVVHPQQDPTKAVIDATAVFRGRPPAWEQWSRTDRQVFKKICGESMCELEYEIPF